MSQSLSKILEENKKPRDLEKARVSWRKWYYRNKDSEKFRQLDSKKLKDYYQKNKVKILKKSKEMVKRNDLKYITRYLTRSAIESGKLIKQPCEVCKSLLVQAHHSDYSKPLLVNWLCKKHHAELHRKYKQTSSLL